MAAPPGTLYHQRIYCQTEDAFVHQWTESAEALTACPTDPVSHVISPDSGGYIEIRESNRVVIDKEPGYLTNGHVKIQSVAFEMPAAADASTPGVATVVLDWPFDIAVQTIRFCVAADCVGCAYTADIGFRTVVGALTADALTGATVLSVSPTVFEHADLGYVLTLAEGGSVDPDTGELSGGSPVQELGVVVARNVGDGTITVASATSADFHAAGPTLVCIHARPSDALEFGIPAMVNLGDDRPVAMSIPAGLRVHSRMSNPHTDGPRRLVGWVSYSY